MSTRQKRRKLIVGLALFLGVLLASSLSAYSYTMHYQKGLTQWDREKAYNGYVIFSARGLSKTILVDMNGNVVHMWDGSGQEMLPPELANGEKGHVLIKLGSKLQERNWDNEVVWEYDTKRVNIRQHHDWQKLPNGNYLVLCREEVPENLVPKEFYGLGIEGKEPVKMTTKMFGDRIVELTPEGKIVWDWHGYEHLDLHKVCNLGEGASTCIGRGDWTHFNAIHYCTNPGYEGKVLASNRHHNEAIMIDKETGDIVWRWGEDVLGHQHDVQMIDAGLPGEGNVLIFDNGYHSKCGSGTSHIYEVDPKTNEIVWSFNGISWVCGSFRSWHISGCNRLPNGNTFITEGEPGRLFQVTKEGEIVWEYTNPFVTYRIRNGEKFINPSVFKARVVPPSWVPEPIELTPEMATAAILMGEAKSHWDAADALVQQANQLLKYSTK